MSVEIRPVETKSEKKEFLNFPYRLYAKESIWVAPLKFERAQHTNRLLHNFGANPIAWQDCNFFCHVRPVALIQK